MKHIKEKHCYDWLKQKVNLSIKAEFMEKPAGSLLMALSKDEWQALCL